MARAARPTPTEKPHPTRSRAVVLGASLLAMLIASTVVGLVLTSRAKADNTAWLPIKEVTFAGALRQVDGEELRRFASGINGSMLRTDLNDIKTLLKQVPWVRDAEIRRRFPATIEVALEEHRALAKWNDVDGVQNGLVNTYGEIFEAEAEGDAQIAALPLLSGPKGSAKEVVDNYQRFKARLLAINQTPVAVVLSARRAWQITLDDGALLELGKAAVDARLARYVDAYPVVPALQLANARVDLRYQSGMAIKATEAVAPAPASPRATPQNQPKKRV